MRFKLSHNEYRQLKRIASWELSDEFWSRVGPLAPQKQRNTGGAYQRKPGGGKKPQAPRKVFAGILYMLRTGCPWKAVPKSEYGSGSAVRRYFLEWVAAGLFLALWRNSLLEYGELEGLGWEWRSLDGAIVKAPLALESVGRNPTGRGRHGGKRSVMADAKGAPLAIVLSGANTHDAKLLAEALGGVVIVRPQGGGLTQNLWMPVMWANPPGRK